MKKIGIIGCGPRGLAALEKLVARLVKKEDAIKFRILLFEVASHPGAGQVWRLEQSDANWLNIDDKSLKGLKGRKEIKHKKFTIPEFPGFADWINQFTKNQNQNNDKYQFYYRSTMGKYLNQRFNSIFEVLQQKGYINLFKSEIVNLVEENGQILIIDEFGKRYQVDESLLTIGHQPTYLSDQMSKWNEKVKLHKLPLELNPYDDGLQNRIVSHSKIAIRGFGLATIDLIRMFITERDGTFSNNENDIFLNFLPTGLTTKLIIPFSLDGLPPVPKPYGSAVDSNFNPGKDVIKKFEKDVISLLKKPELIRSSLFLIELVADIVANGFLEKSLYFYSHTLNKKQIKETIIAWLQDMSLEHHLILNTSLDTLEYMRSTAQMACGKIEASLDYAIGQIWRHLQPSLYKTLSHSNLEDKIMQEIIELDENTKRYSYGPPVDSVLQLIALADQGILNLNFTEDPSVMIDSSGWILTNKKGDNISTEVMINSVLDSPKLNKISSKLVRNLLKNDILKPMTSDLGVETFENGLVKFNNKHQKYNISMLGRNCKGSVIGVDAILECFGERIEDWAEACASRFSDKAITKNSNI